MGIGEKAFVRDVVRAHLQASAPDRLQELETDFDSLFAAAEEREKILRESGSSQGLPFDASFGAGVFVGTILWMALRLARAALAAESPRDRTKKLKRAERQLWDETDQPETVIEILRLVLERMDRIERGMRGPEPQAQGLATFSPSDSSILRLLVRRESPVKLVFEATSDSLGLNNKDLGSLTLEGDPKAQAQDELGRRVDDLSDLALAGERGQESARHQLADMAVALFQNLPQGVRDLLWSQAGRIETLQILSDEPYIPWELMKLQDDDGQEGPFLCEAFRVTRWLRKFPQTALTFPLQSIAVVLTTDSNLPSSRAEKEDLVALVGAERLAEIEPTLPEVKQALLKGDHDGWHFTGHGSARSQDPNRAAIHLQGSEFLMPENLVTAKANLGRLRPLLFLNGCDTGRGGFSLTGLGGWAQQSLAAGAGAFIGTLWPVRDQKARAFAQAFYQQCLGGDPIAEAVRQARLRVREQFPGDPAWLAYTVYCHPDAQI